MPLSHNQIKALKTAFAKRSVLKKSTNAIRLVNGQGDLLEGLILEQYDKHFVAQIFSGAWLKEIQALQEFLLSCFEMDYFIVKDRTKTASSDAQAIKGQVFIAHKSSRTKVIENGISFEVDLNDTLNTGLFLDMRSNRKMVAYACSGQKVLNCFSYTCSFGLYARMHKAREVLNVDVSRKILERGRRNYELNNIKEQAGEFIRADALAFLERAVKKENRFDVIILDPPSFARAEGKVFSVQKDLPQLLKLSLSVLNERGKLFVSTNWSGMSHARLEELIRKATDRKLKVIARLGQDIDFPGSGNFKESHLVALWIEVK